MEERGRDGFTLSSLPGPLREPVAGRLHDWFVDDRGRDRTYRVVRRFDDPPLNLDDLADLVQRWIAAD